MDIQIPRFWDTIEKLLHIDPTGIQEIKEILTLLNYTTIQSIVKFNKPTEIKLIELEFLNRKREFGEKYEHLKDFTFGSGVHSILVDIASKVKKHFVGNESENVDVAKISEKVLNDGKQVVSIDFFYGLENSFLFTMHVFDIRLLQN